MLDYPDREGLEAVPEEDTPATQQTRESGVRVSALAILCVLSGLLSFLFFPALAALPLGIFALQRIDASDGKLTGRYLAIPGICLSVVALSAWLALTAVVLAAWTVLSTVAVAAWVAVIAVGWMAWKILTGIWNALF